MTHSADNDPIAHARVRALTRDRRQSVCPDLERRRRYGALVTQAPRETRGAVRRRLRSPFNPWHFGGAYALVALGAVGLGEHTLTFFGGALLVNVLVALIAERSGFVWAVTTLLATTGDTSTADRTEVRAVMRGLVPVLVVLFIVASVMSVLTN